MSHLSKIKTQIYDLDVLKKALKDLNLEWKPSSTSLCNFQGQVYTVDLAIEQPNTSDFGFIWNGKGATCSV